MIPKAIECGDVRKEDVAVYLSVCMFIASLPDGLTCHEVCKLTAMKHPELLVWVRGKFNGFDHSWLRVKTNHKLIIDPYPWCGCTPQMLVVHGYHLNPWANLYVESIRMTFPQTESVRNN